MKKRIIGLFIFVIFWSLNYSNSFAKDVTLIYTGSTHAMLYPCFCPIEPDGGVARRATLVKQLRKSNPDILLLDSGNFFSSGLQDENTQNTQLDMQRAIVNLRAMELMKYDAVNLSEDEFNFGEKFFEENAGKSKLEFVSANLKSERILPHVTKELAGIKFGIIGLSSSKVKNKVKDLKVIDPKIALKDSVAQLKAKGTDIIILLSNLGDEDKKLINEIPGIDIIIDGQGHSEKGAPFKSGNVIFLRPAWQGRRLGKVILNIQDKKIIDYKTEEIRVSDKISDAPEILAILPRCFSDTGCKKAGFVGTCQDAGNSKANCLFKEAEKVQLTVITPKGCSVCDTKAVVTLLGKQFPGLRIKYLLYPDKSASDLIKKLNISGLPIFILGKEVERAEGFSKLKSSLEAKDDFYILKPEASGLAYFLNREETKGRLDVFLSLYNKDAFKLLETIQEFKPIIHLLAVKYGNKFDAPNGASEVEEDLRAVCVQKYYPEAFLPYLSCRSKNIASSWWDDCLQGADLDKIKFCARGTEGTRLLEENTKLNNEIKVMFGPTYLVNNKEIFTTEGVPSKEDLKKVIK